MTVTWVKYTTAASIIAQLITGIYGVKGILYTLPPPHHILVDVLKIEMIVQTIELFFYVFLLTNLNVLTMATTRYYDWFITTPMMLFSTCVTYNYLGVVKGETLHGKVLNLRDFIVEHQKSLSLIFFANLGMLLFGYVGELGLISKAHAAIYGFLCLGVSMYTIYKEFGRYIQKELYVFYILLAVWSFYGIVYLFSPIYKNIVYNFLDIVAKNFFGLFLYYNIKQIANSLSGKTI